MPFWHNDPAQTVGPCIFFGLSFQAKYSKIISQKSQSWCTVGSIWHTPSERFGQLFQFLQLDWLSCQQGSYFAFLKMHGQNLNLKTTVPGLKSCWSSQVVIIPASVWLNIRHWNWRNRFFHRHWSCYLRMTTLALLASGKNLEARSLSPK